MSLVPPTRLRATVALPAIGMSVILGLGGCGRIGFESIDPGKSSGGAAGTAGASGSLAGSGGTAGAAGTGGGNLAGDGGAAGSAGGDLAGDGGVGGAAAPSCSDGIQNGDESGVDCGGLICPLCPGCVWDPFGPPEVITGLGLDGDVYGPTISADGTTLVFSEVGSVSEDLFMATRSGRGTVFSPAVALAEINTDSLEATPFLAADGLSLYFSSDRSGGLGSRDLMIAQRTAVGDPFSAPAFLAVVNHAQLDHVPTLTPDELVIVFESTRSGSSGAPDLWTATRSTKTDPFESPTALSELNTTSREGGPGLASDALTLYFVSDRSGGLGAHDVWVATRADPTQQFDAPQALAVVNSSSEELDSRPSGDGRELCFASNRSGRYEIWRSLRYCR